MAEPTPPPVNAREVKGIATLSKKRFFEIQTQVKKILADDEAAADRVMRVICDVMMFDPMVSRYSEDIREKLVINNRKWRQKKKEQQAASN